ncbi:MAG: hypothetical protein HY286_15645 [Planctomycetes bacterium]|nr:hypothetical protein [Planctomycetota bacterium]
MITPRIIAVFVLSSATLFAFAETYKVTDRTKVYLGSADAFTSPAVVESSKVMEILPAMKTIKDESVKKDSARWFILVNEANQQFQKALKAVAKEHSYDLVAEVGSVTGPKAITDATDLAIAAAKN